MTGLPYLLIAAVAAASTWLIVRNEEAIARARAEHDREAHR